jgi:hypothetical protein
LLIDWLQVKDRDPNGSGEPVLTQRPRAVAATVVQTSEGVAGSWAGILGFGSGASPAHLWPWVVFGTLAPLPAAAGGLDPFPSFPASNNPEPLGFALHIGVDKSELGTAGEISWLALGNPRLPLPDPWTFTAGGVTHTVDEGANVLTQWDSDYEKKLAAAYADVPVTSPIVAASVDLAAGNAVYFVLGPGRAWAF